MNKNIKNYLMVLIAVAAFNVSSSVFSMKIIIQIKKAIENVFLGDIFDNIGGGCDDGWNLCVKRVRDLVEDESTDINKIKYYDTALIKACQHSTVYVRELLKHKNIDVNKAGEYGFTPLDYACERGDIEKVQLLLEHGAQESVNGNNYFKMLPLYWACISSYLDMVKLLLKNGANIDDKTFLAARDELRVPEKLSTDLMVNRMFRRRRFEDDREIVTRILAILKLTQKFDKCRKLNFGKKDNSWEENLKDPELIEFAKELKKSKRAGVQNIFEKMGGDKRYMKFSDCRIRTYE